MCFPVNIAKYLRTPFFTEDLWWLLLRIQKPVKYPKSDVKRFGKTLISWNLLKIFAQSSILNDGLGSEYVSEKEYIS